MKNKILAEQIKYYRARAGEYDNGDYFVTLLVVMKAVGFIMGQK